jgi:hypothetical protein
VRLAGIVALLICTGSAEAQVGPRARTDTLIGPNVNAGAVRLFGGAGGMFIGGIAGGYLGYNLLPHTPNGDDPGLIELLQGLIVGSAVGAAVGVSAPNLRSVCNFGTRFGRAMLGSGGAAAVLYFASGGARNGSAIFVVPVGSVGGSLAALGRCWKSYL